MKKSKSFLLLLAASMLHTVGVSAKQRSFNEARAIAERQAKQLGIEMDASSLAKAKSLNATALGGKPVPYYVFPNGDGKGFTIVSGDDRLPDIVGYSDNGTYTDGCLPEAYRAYLEMYQTTVDAAFNGSTAAATSVAQARQRAQGTNGRVRVEPLLGGIKWNQDEPYNNLCPVYNGSDRAATGCVATAMAQVMAYWKYPASLQTDIPSYVTRTNSIRMNAIKKGVKYDWDNMLGSYDGNYSATEANAVATLMLHCGAAVEMNYGYTSGANVTAKDLATYFGYDSDLMLDIDRRFFSLDEWSGLIDTELKAGRPVLYAGQSSSGGHQFVCDGADGKGLYHINWGWGGYQDGYFDLAILNPTKGGIGSGTASDGYSRYNDAIIGIQPDNGVVDKPLVTQPPILAYPWENDDRAVSVVTGTRSNANGDFEIMIRDRFNNYSNDNFSGYYGYGVKNVDGSYKLVSNMKSGTLKGKSADGVYGFLFTGSVSHAFPVGRTTVYSVYSEDGKTWHRCLYLDEQPIVFEATATSLSYVENTLAGSVSADGDIIGGFENPFTLTLTNNSDDEYQGLLNIYGSKFGACPAKASTDVYVTVPAHGTFTCDFKLTPVAGTYNVWVKDAQTNAVIVKAQKFSVEQAGTPVLELVSVSTNAEPGLYESELAYFGDDRVRMPKTNDAEAVFSYGIKNTGDLSMFSYGVILQSYPSDGYRVTQGTVKVPGNGAITYITVKTVPSNFSGDRSLFARLLKVTSDGDVELLPTSLSGMSLKCVDEPNYSYTLKPCDLAVYVAGDVEAGMAGVPLPADVLDVRGGKGEIVIASGEERVVAVYAADGSKVRSVKVAAGDTERVGMKAGLYIVNGRKVVVK